MLFSVWGLGVGVGEETASARTELVCQKHSYSQSAAENPLYFHMKYFFTHKNPFCFSKAIVSHTLSYYTTFTSVKLLKDCEI